MYKRQVNVLASEGDYTHKMPQYTRVLSESLEKTEGLLENLLVWTQTQMKGYKVNPSNQHLKEFVESNVGFFADMAAQKAIKLSSNTTVCEPVFLDTAVLEIILRNLLHNALKFTPNGGEIQVSSRQENNALVLEVTDSGLGMDPEGLDRVRKRAGLYTTPGTNKESGTGLGLMLCYELVSLLKGTITIRSEKEKGSTFSLILPLTKIS